ncbi:MAG: hypothetical protein U5R31_06380 [Acidimicrobiia bacterium]|nr:hypothetical protein [Acidimicrobiia bacterium]
MGRPRTTDAARDAYRNALAEQLGVQPSEVQSAIRTLVASGLSDAVDAGRLGQEEADELLGAFDEGRLREVVRENRL